MGALRHFGFRPNGNPLFDECLVYEFENFDLEAAACSNEYAQERVFFSGLIERTERVMYAPIEFNIPTDVMCVWQCAALLSYYLRSYPIPNPPWWLVEGRQRQDLLPWAIESAARQAAYDALPKCFVQRDWLRLALKTLSIQIASMPDDMPVEFEFKDGVLSIRCNGNTMVTAATGASWPDQVTVQVRELRTLPKRLMSKEICLLVEASHLKIGNSFHQLSTNAADNSGSQASLFEEE
jgi:hypothetical protein